MLPASTVIWPDSATILKRSRHVFCAHWKELLRLCRSVIKTSDQDTIHDLRVASRRFRAALELFYPFVQRGERAVLRKGVRKLTGALGGLRNIDEAELFFRSRAPSIVPVDGMLHTALADLRSRELKQVLKRIKAFDHVNLDRIVRSMVSGLHEDVITTHKSVSILAYFSEVSIRQYLPIHQRLAGATTPGRRTSRHALRIAIKKWRYFFEIVAPILDRDYARFLELLKEYQSILGIMNDMAEFEMLLKNLKLPHTTRHAAAQALQTEEMFLLESFTELTRQKPLTYTFLV